MGVVSTKLVAAGGVAVAGCVVAAKKFLDARPDPKAAEFRASLAGMDSLKGLSELSLEREEGRAGRGATAPCQASPAHSRCHGSLRARALAPS